MSGTRTEPAPPERESFGISDILAEREGELPPDLLPNQSAPEEPEKPASAKDDAEAVADQLRRDADAARARATAAEQRAAQESQRAREATAEVTRSRTQAYEAEYNSISSALADREAEADRLKAEMRTQAEAGDHARMAEISLRLGEVGAELVQLRQGKQAYEAERANRLREPEKREQPPAPTEQTTVGVPRDQFLATRTPATQDWLRKNDKFFTDQQFFNMVTGADAIARGRGIAADTPEYFRFIEEQAGMTSAPSARQPRGSSAPPSAPPSREAPGPSGRNGRAGDIVISPEDRRVAEWMRIDAADYVKEKQKLYDTGELPHRRR